MTIEQTDVGVRIDRVSQKCQHSTAKTDWRPFNIPFVYISTRYKWTNEQKLDKLIECLRDRALKYFSTRPDAEKQNFETLCQKMSERFGEKDPPP